MKSANSSRLTRAEQKAYQEWLDLCDLIKKATTLPPEVYEAEQEKRIAELRGNFIKFCKYYFPHYCVDDFGWFHKKAAKEILSDPNAFAILEWAREHAKSVFADVMIPMFLYCNDQLTGFVVASANQDKAADLLSDLQAEFEVNQRLIHDYGYMVNEGSWRDGAFMTKDGVGFWAFGRGQSPRGIRKAANRPNYAVVDDIDDKVIVRNEQRVRDAVDWVLEDLYGALSIKGARLVIAGNRIHKKSILAHLVGDIEPGDPKRQGIIHIKVFAIENKRHNKADSKSGRPAWKERYTLKMLDAKMTKMGYRASRREYFHEHIEEGLIFQHDWIQWQKTLRLDRYDGIIVYCDPSFKDTKKSDYKAIVALGKFGKYVDVLKAWVRQGTATAMVKVFYDWFEEYGNGTRYYMEANFLQDLLLDEFTIEGEKRDYQMPIRADKRSKDNKEARIENLSPLFERGLIRFNEAERQSPDMQTLISQFLAFPYGHDDGPDAMEGGVFLLQGMGRSSKFKPRSGKYRRRSKRI